MSSNVEDGESPKQGFAIASRKETALVVPTKPYYELMEERLTYFINGPTAATDREFRRNL